MMERLKKWFGALMPRDSGLVVLPSDSDEDLEPVDSTTRLPRGNKPTSHFIHTSEDDSGFKLSNLFRVRMSSTFRLNSGLLNEGIDSTPEEQHAPSVAPPVFGKSSTVLPSQQNTTSSVSNVDKKNAQVHSDKSKSSIVPAPNDRTISTSLDQTEPSAIATNDSESSTKTDCVECRVLVSSVGMGVSAYVLYHAWKNQAQYTGFKRFAFNGQCFFLSLGLTLMSISAALGIGMYKPVEEGESKKTVQDLVKEDYEMFKEKLSWISSSASSK